MRKTSKLYWNNAFTSLQDVYFRSRDFNNSKQKKTTKKRLTCLGQESVPDLKMTKNSCSLIKVGWYTIEKHMEKRFQKVPKIWFCLTHFLPPLKSCYSAQLCSVPLESQQHCRLKLTRVWWARYYTVSFVYFFSVHHKMVRIQAPYWQMEDHIEVVTRIYHISFLHLLSYV